LPATLAELLASGYVPRTVKAEMQENLLRRLREGLPTLPGIVGFEHTVGPQVERAILAGHDFVLLGERGQGKTRLIRSLIGLLDEWLPYVAGCEISDEPTAPVCARCRRMSAELGSVLTCRSRGDIAVSGMGRSSRHQTPPSVTSSAISTR